ncbi:QoxB, Quinol oxidase subunit II [Pseudooceanicola nanhaiensis]|uniref:QoxB, Quinol oxidase subunit II n=1 Tax=Pseudooceanicola nanhaiensis TaxID=375761 RepID=A0A917WLE9_9RHOB|nr:cytochrome B [Pseudooceanicola nanhaiensis]GGM12864.1 QoxB, Quinol oxidase subunit II [Pseudooceanicola nanhaiensis]
MHPAGPAAATIATLWWVLLAGATAIFLFVAGLIVLAWRRAPGKSDERVFVVGLGLAFPLVVLAALLAYGLFIGERLLPRAGPDVVTVQAEARQWAWRFGYADAPGRVTEGVLHIPAGRPVDVAITTADVIHAFWVPRLAGKLDAVPGRVNVLRIEAGSPGRYEGLGSEYNGPGYRDHRFTVVAHDPAGWDRFLQDETP